MTWDDNETGRIYIGKKLIEVETDSVFSFASIIEEDFDSLYISQGYSIHSVFKKDMTIEEFHKEASLSLLNFKEAEQGVIFLKNKKFLFYALIESDTAYIVITNSDIRCFVSDANFKIIMDKNGRRRINLLE